MGRKKDCEESKGRDHRWDRALEVGRYEGVGKSLWGEAEAGLDEAPKRHRRSADESRLKIYDPDFQFSNGTSPDVSRHHNAFKETRGNVTTGVRRWFLTGVEGEGAGNDTTRPATQVGPRIVEGGVWEATTTVLMGRRWGREPIAPVIKTGRLAMSDCPTFSDFCGQVNDFGSEN